MNDDGFVLKPKRERDFSDLESYKTGWLDCMDYYKIKIGGFVVSGVWETCNTCDTYCELTGHLECSECQKDWGWENE